MRLIFITFLLLTIVSCVKPPNYSVVPTLAVDSLNKNHIVSSDDSLTLFLSFTDGDGDIGTLDTTPVVFITDNRTGTPLGYSFPSVTPGGKTKQISGQIIITIPGSDIGCIPMKPLDTLHYSIYLRDRAGNESNTANTPDIYLNCQ